MKPLMMSKNHSFEVSEFTVLFLTLVTGLLVSVSSAQEKKTGHSEKEAPRKKPSELVTKIYQLSPSFVQSYPGKIPDPFAADDEIHLRVLLHPKL